MIPSLFAGFYCDATKLAENDAFNKKVLLALIITMLVLAPIGAFLIWNLKGRSKAVKVLTVTAIVLVVVMILIGFFAYSFKNTPHWC